VEDAGKDLVQARDSYRVRGMLVVLIARVPERGIDRFRSYEGQVLPLIAEHGGELQRRLRSDDGCTEVHLVAFPSAEAFAAYRADPRRARVGHLLAESGAQTELLELRDVE
jgi:hypothetical protein